MADPPVAARRTFNIASHLPRMADLVPQQAAVIVPWQRHPDAAPGCAAWTFSELELESNRIANGFASIGIERGTRTVVMIRPGLEFTAVVFALFKVGAAPVMIDPGMGVSRMVDCIAEVEPEAFVGVPLAQLVRVLNRRRFSKLRAIVTVGRRFGWGGATLQELRCAGSPRYTMADTAADEVAAILFTTGSTGPPKGVVYEHGMFDAQVRLIQAWYDMQPGEIDMPAFPLFALFSTAMGMTCVIPEMDPSRPGRCDPAKLVRDIVAHRVTTSFGSPAIWRRVGEHCVSRGIRLPTLKRILTAGAPIPWRVIESLHRVLPDDGDVHTPYGATESLPVASISGRELFSGGFIAQSRRGAGTCVGRPFPGIDVRIIRLSDSKIATWSSALEVPPGQHGEIVVAGDVVTRRYDHNPGATALHKIYDGARVWHRIGDVGYMDREGRLWFCGRKAHRVETSERTLFTIECEAIFNEHPDVARSALVGIRRAADLSPRGPTPPPAADVGPHSPCTSEPVILIEPKPGRMPRGRRRAEFVAELIERAQADPRTRLIRTVLFHRAFPVDIRHNAKIFREKLAVWAAERLA
ncbi:MAG: AMP-binding protein [Phycisphaerales bacterium]|nr:AMP-binding protein [Phycisphaerales bacterium]